MPKSNVRHPAAWRRLYSQNAGLEIGEVRRCTVTKKSISGRTQTVASNQLSTFSSNDMPSYMRQEFDRVRRTEKTERLMNCRELRKFGGIHGKIDRPLNRKIVSEIGMSVAVSYLRIGGVMLHDPAKQERVVEYNGRVVGRVTNATMASILNTHKTASYRVPGTNQIAYKAV